MIAFLLFLAVIGLAVYYAVYGAISTFLSPKDELPVIIRASVEKDTKAFDEESERLKQEAKGHLERVEELFRMTETEFKKGECDEDLFYEMHRHYIESKATYERIMATVK